MRAAFSVSARAFAASARTSESIRCRSFLASSRTRLASALPCSRIASTALSNVIPGTHSRLAQISEHQERDDQAEDHDRLRNDDERETPAEQFRFLRDRAHRRGPNHLFGQAVASPVPATVNAIAMPISPCASAGAGIVFTPPVSLSHQRAETASRPLGRT